MKNKPVKSESTRNVLITGGAGFIGSNYAERVLKQGQNLTIYDNLSRKGAEENLTWLKNAFGEAVHFIKGDIRDYEHLSDAVKTSDVIVHLAAQVAVTSSVTDPRFDFEVNALGTLNVLEAARLNGRNPVVLYASTNKVYGEMSDIEVLEGVDAYGYAEYPNGITENNQLDFHSPYGCSKGTGDQYMRDYYRIYGLRTIVLRQSCIYGPRQFGVEDQGWIAWFIIAALAGRQITIYGDGKQVRDVLYIDDLLNCYDLAVDKIDVSAGQIFNVGGGKENTLAIWTQFAPILIRHLKRDLVVSRADWRPGDQKIYVSDIRKAEALLGWKPVVTAEIGIEQLFNWVKDNQGTIERVMRT